MNNIFPFFRKIQWKLSCFLSVLSLMVLHTLPVRANQVEKQTVTIRVGYTENYGVNPQPHLSGNEGYLYEYLQNISNYTPVSLVYEFIPITVDESLEALRDGRVDIVGPLNWTEERGEEFIYTKNNFGVEVSFLSAVDNGQVYYGDYRHVDGRVILAQSNSENIHLLYQFLDEQSISAEIVPYIGSDLATEMILNGYDYCLTSSMYPDDRLKPVAKLGEAEIFYVALPENQYILDLIDQGMEEMYRKEYLYASRLYLKYYNLNLQDQLYISPEEYEVLQNVKVYNVGINTNLSVMSYLDESGNPAGVLVDMMDRLAESANISFHYLSVDPECPPTGLDLLLFDCQQEGEEHNHVESPPFLELPLLMLKKYYNVSTIRSIGITKDYVGSLSLITNHYPTQQIAIYDNYSQLYDAYTMSQVDSMILTTVSLNDMRNTVNLEENSVIPISPTLQYVLSYGVDFPEEKILIFNKLLTHIDETQLEYTILRHSSFAPPETWVDYLRDNPMLPTLLIVFYFLLLRFGEEKKKRALRKLIDYDDVTNLYSERKFIEEAEKILAANGDKKYSVIAFDIDNFKYINEMYHYEAGTSVLNVLGSYVRGEVEDILPVARSFSDNFLVLEESENLMEKIEKRLGKDSEVFTKINEFLGESYNFSFSIGVYHIENGNMGLSYMIDCANLARGLGKKMAETTVHTFSEEMSQERANNNEIVATMDHAVAMREFEMYFQPKFTISGLKICGAEALVRWNQGDVIVSPGNFIPLFEKNGFIEKLDYYVVEEVCRFIQMNYNINLPIISLNLSGITIMKPDLVENLMYILGQYGVKPNQLDIEITESAFVDNFELAIQKILKLRELGFTLSMDDFGTGISTLHRLKEIAVDVLKIDRAFVVDSLEHEKGNIILKNIIIMAKELQLETVAEGVETQEQLNFLNKLGCDVGQGYFYSRPLQSNDFLARLAQEVSETSNEQMKKLKKIRKA